MFRIPSALLKLFFKIVLFVYFLAAGLFLGVRYWVLPNIDQWRPYIAQQLSAALKTRVSLGVVKADWNGLHPRLELGDVAFTDRRQRQVLSLPRVQAVLSWRSLFTGTPQFVSLQAQGIDISLRRDRRQRLWVLGQSFQMEALDQQDAGAQDEILAWLATQRRIVLADATIRWVDETRHAPPLVLRSVTLTLRSHGADHSFSARAIPPSELGQSLDVRGQFRQASGGGPQAFSLKDGAGQVYVNVEKMRPLGWSPWLDMPQPLESGEVSAQAWLTLAAGGIARYTSDVTVKQGRWRFGDKAYVQADFLRLYMAGPWAGFRQIFPASAGASAPAAPALPPIAGAAPAPAVEFRLQARRLGLDAGDIFAQPLDFNSIDAQGTARNLPGSVLRVQADRVDLANKDMDASLQGSWQQGGSGPAGLIDIHGKFKRAMVAAIHEYLPGIVDLDAREWMAKGLLAGVIQDADLTLNGDLEHFPFAEDPSKGNFKVLGRYSGGMIDYLPPEGKTLGWPRLNDMQGTIALHRADLRLVSDQAWMQPAAGLPIQLSQVSAHIPNIEDKPVLHIDGLTAAKGEAYLALMKHTPLGEMLGGVFNEASADGDWEVPLALTIPLLNSRDTKLRGAIRFSGNSLRLAPEMPAFSQISGALDFTDEAMSSSGLKADFLGGPVSFTGGVGGPQKGLQLQGRASAKALADYVGLEGMKRLQGTVPYKATVQQPDAKSFSLSLDSTLSGLALDLPPPLGKSAGQAMPLHVDWRRHADGKSMALDVALGQGMRATLLHRNGRKEGAYFHAAAVGVNQEPDLQPEGLSVDVSYPSVDIDSWDRIVSEFSTSAKPGGRRERPLLPDARQLRLQTAQARVHGLKLDELTFTARQPEPEQWRVDVSSTQTAGTLFWREARGRIAGRIDANFDRLALGRDKAGGAADDKNAEDSSFRIDDDLDIPGVNLYVKNLRLYGRDAGELSVVGVNQARGELWRLDELKLAGRGASLAGSGMWRLSGKDRGLTLDAQAHISDLGAYFDQVGMKDVMKAGKGTLKGRFEWRNMPWDVSKEDLNGKIEFDLEKGRFSNVNSRSSRLLELLSLQSVKRMARLDFNPAGLTKEGFPYDKLRGTLVLDSGVMSTSDYRVIGPVGTIVIGGDVDLVRENLNLQAVVVPNLDVSGAAVAAGIAINPIVGVGAFLTQWLLQGPLAKAMTAQYQIHGDWDDPQIKEIAVPAANGKAAANPGAAPKAGTLPRVEP
ncbi:YhdP family protein [Pollutimonas bauzanensis]|uniref:YhdP family protein n=1 Tax=Pollutimonas bauzanensis TaxID=658167 RepID=UPI00116045CB|nr:YhdP family protein [Pollutimonas bauzanensis]